jgi:hypothetical protein
MENDWNIILSEYGPTTFEFDVGLKKKKIMYILKHNFITSW